MNLDRDGIRHYACGAAPSSSPPPVVAVHQLWLISTSLGSSPAPKARFSALRPRLDRTHRVPVGGRHPLADTTIPSPTLIRALPCDHVHSASVLVPKRVKFGASVNRLSSSVLRRAPSRDRASSRPACEVRRLVFDLPHVLLRISAHPLLSRVAVSTRKAANRGELRALRRAVPGRGGEARERPEMDAGAGSVLIASGGRPTGGGRHEPAGVEIERRRCPEVDVQPLQPRARRLGGDGDQPAADPTRRCAPAPACQDKRVVAAVPRRSRPHQPRVHFLAHTPAGLCSQTQRARQSYSIMPARTARNAARSTRAGEPVALIYASASRRSRRGFAGPTHQRPARARGRGRADACERPHRRSTQRR